jgi:hypothetical protein
MANMYITEYKDMGYAGDGLQIPQEPDVADQKVTFTTSTASAAFNAATRYVMIRLDAAGHVKFGTGPTATTSNRPLTADVEYYFGVASGSKVAAVTA